jgi:nickel/cobalt transporter (NicO) family protein
VVTATHTVGVVGLGIAILLASTFSVPQDYQPKIELASGVIIALLGAYLLVARWRDLRKGSVNDQHPHDHDHTHDHDHPHPHSHPHIDRHSHAERVAAQGPSKRAIVGLGVLGGLLPCPDALAILLLAVGVGQFALGLGLVVAFSLGLAAVLIGLGIAVVKMKSTLEKRQSMRLARSSIWANWVPVASAALVVVIGVVMVATAIRV